MSEDPFITFERDDTSVIANVNSCLGTCEPVFLFSFTCADQEYAALLTVHLEEELEGLVRSIRMSAYDLGWEDAKKRRRKKTIFWGWLARRRDFAWWK